MATPGPFDRDLGYLDAFLDKLDAHATRLGGDAAGRLKALVSEERRRWTEVRTLLAGEPVGPSPAGLSPPRAAPPAAPPAGANGSTITPTLTVGSLRRGKEKR